ncbi:TPA: hypothetical protein DEP21_01530 [Patescibacteria group bacterium]|nr:hypothetical protein [Candidatus Gracilibacteria bacterium]
MTSIVSYFSSYTFEQVLTIEESDRQFLALKKAWEQINQKVCPLFDTHQVANFFLLMVLQNATISYQIAGSGELWWEEFSERLVQDFSSLFPLFLMRNPTSDWFYNLMTTSRYNKRLYNLKTAKINKFQVGKLYSGTKNMYDYYQDMELLLKELSSIMGMDTSTKTMTFAIKMFGYAARVVYGQFISYPMSINIPVDSRIRKIWSLLDKTSSLSDKDIQISIQKVSKKVGIAPLHLDSLLWIEFWKGVKT